MSLAMIPEDRFTTGAPAYAAYLQTVEGRLRLDLAWENLRAFLFDESEAQRIDARRGQMRRALDLGGGTGALALRLAAQGFHVAVVDSSATMLQLAKEAARRADMLDQIEFHQADAAEAVALFEPGTFDVAVCHNVLEYVPDPGAAMSALWGLVRTGGVVSLLARQRAGEAMRHALKAHDLAAARRALDAEWATESLYGGPARVFDAHSLHTLAEDNGLTVFVERGVRVVADYLPASLSETTEAYARLLAFELELGARPEFANVARYRQTLARNEG
ncbi:MAG: methyltransferase domain-containing protein [Acidobacteriota bacterium]|nr:methyltransferase domain-containing protein [Acidobacteriota bacterium]